MPDMLVKLYNLEKMIHREGKEDKPKVTGAVYMLYDSVGGFCAAKVVVEYIEKPKAPKAPKAKKGKGAAQLLDDEEYQQFLAWKAAQAK